MKFSKNIMVIAVLCIVVPICAVNKQQKKQAMPKKQMAQKRTNPRGIKQQAPGSKMQQRVEQQPVVRPKLSMESYINNRVSALQGDLINDIFPKKDTIERIVLEFKNEYPGPNKDADTTFIYDAIISNPEIKKLITLENAVQIYKLLRETINNIWDKQNELIWSR